MEPTASGSLYARKTFADSRDVDDVSAAGIPVADLTAQVKLLCGSLGHPRTGAGCFLPAGLAATFASFLTAAFFRATFLGAFELADCAAFWAARTAAQRFFVASLIRFLPGSTELPFRLRRLRLSLGFSPSLPLSFCYPFPTSGRYPAPGFLGFRSRGMFWSVAVQHE